ncbi:MAG: hypothetical protein KF708_12320 [Pirellulales bacterium]|nr:hypothetical protein [Pirellulales bacterium]
MKTHDRLTRAYLEVIRMVALFVRLHSTGERRLPDEHLFDLMDAIHNIPEFLVGTNDHFTHESMRQFELGCYDEKWGHSSGLHLVRILDDALAQYE